MNKRIISFIVLSVAMLCIIAPLRASAQSAIDTAQFCNLDVVFKPEQIKASDVEFRLYKVASVSSDGKFTVDSSFSSYGLEEMLAAPSEENYTKLAAKLSEVISNNSSVGADYKTNTDSNGIASYTGVATGLYFVMGDSYTDTNSNTIYFPLNYLVSLPGKDDAGNWTYSVQSKVKWEKRTIENTYAVQVLKVWSDISSNLHSSDSVKVELYKDGVKYDTQTLSKSNSWTYTWTNLDSKASWSVKEQAVSGYTGAVERKGDRFVITNTLNSSTTPDKGKLPQTGQLWWPAPMLIAAGIMFIFYGLYIKRNKETK